MQVNENRLDTILQDFVETFNDCACCPISEGCKRRSINSLQCADDLLEKLKE